MKITYDPENDCLYIELSENKSVDSQVVSDDVVLDFDTRGALVSIDIHRASKSVDLTRLEAQGLPRVLQRDTR